MSFLHLTSPRFNNSLDVGPVPQVSTQAASSISTTTATGNGTLTSNGATPVSAMGFVWSSTVFYPTLADTVVTDAGTAIGTFSDTLSGLPLTTLIYYAAYATNSIGTGYGQTLMFTTSSGVVTTTGNTLLLMGVG